jgi:hypothetical protein
MIYFYLAVVEWNSPTFTVGSIYCTNGSFERNYFFSHIHPPLPVCTSAPEVVKGEGFFSYDFFFCGVSLPDTFVSHFEMSP